MEPVKRVSKFHLNQNSNSKRLIICNTYFLTHTLLGHYTNLSLRSCQNKKKQSICPPINLYIYQSTQIMTQKLTWNWHHLPLQQFLLCYRTTSCSNSIHLETMMSRMVEIIPFIIILGIMHHFCWKIKIKHIMWVTAAGKDVPPIISLLWIVIILPRLCNRIITMKTIRPRIYITLIKIIFTGSITFQNPTVLLHCNPMKLQSFLCLVS